MSLEDMFNELIDDVDYEFLLQLNDREIEALYGKMIGEAEED